MLMTLTPSPMQLMHAHEPDLLQVGSYLDTYTAFKLLRELDGLVYASNEFDRAVMDALLNRGVNGLIAVEGRVSGVVGDYWETL